MKGLAIPIGVNKSGGAATVKGDVQDKKVITIALGSDENENAFQQGISLGLSMIFAQMENSSVRGSIVARIRKIFEFFQRQNRFVLQVDTIEWEQFGEGELNLKFFYLNIESDELDEFKQTFSSQ